MKITYVLLRCDHCDRPHQRYPEHDEKTRPTVGQLRLLARIDGWVWTHDDGDACPDCCAGRT